jgi:hypothetical protein
MVTNSEQNPLTSTNLNTYGLPLEKGPLRAVPWTTHCQSQWTAFLIRLQHHPRVPKYFLGKSFHSKSAIRSSRRWIPVLVDLLTGSSTHTTSNGMALCLLLSSHLELSNCLINTLCSGFPSTIHVFSCMKGPVSTSAI